MRVSGEIYICKRGDIRSHDDVVIGILITRGEKVDRFDRPTVVRVQVLMQLKLIDLRRHTCNFKLQGVAEIARGTVVVLSYARGQSLKLVHVRRQATDAKPTFPWGGAPGQDRLLLAEPGALLQVPVDVDSLQGRVRSGGENENAIQARAVEESVAVHVINFRSDLKAFIFDVPYHPQTLTLARVCGGRGKGISTTLISDIRDESAYILK